MHCLVIVTIFCLALLGFEPMTLFLWGGGSHHFTAGPPPPMAPKETPGVGTSPSSEWNYGSKFDLKAPLITHNRTECALRPDLKYLLKGMKQLWRKYMLNRLHFLKFYPLSNENLRGFEQNLSEVFYWAQWWCQRFHKLWAGSFFLYIKDTITGLKLINKSKLLMSP